MLKLKPLPNELYEFYPAMSAQTHEEQVKAYAKSHMAEELKTRPVAPVEGLEEAIAFAENAMKGRGQYHVLEQAIQKLVKVASQTEAIIAAKDQTISDLRSEVESLSTIVKSEIADVAGASLDELQADNAALTARVKELDDECNLWKETDASHLNHIQALETQLAAAKETAARAAYRACAETRHVSLGHAAADAVRAALEVKT